MEAKESSIRAVAILYGPVLRNVSRAVTAMRRALVILAVFGMAACGGTSTNPGAASSSPAATPTLASRATPAPPAATKSQFLAGNTSPTYPAGTSGQMALIAQGTLVIPVPSAGETVPIAVRNNTTQSVTQIKAQGSVHDSAGAPVASGSDQGFHPSILQPGQVALGFVYLGTGSSVPKGSTMSVQVSATPSSSPNTYTADLLLTEVNNTGQQIVGTVKNPRDHSIQGPYSVAVFCVNSSGTLQSEFGAFADVSDKLVSGATSPFTVSLYGASCPQFLIGASGYDLTAVGN